MTAVLLMVLLTVPVVHIEVPRRVEVEEPFDVEISITRDPQEKLRPISFGTIGRIVFGDRVVTRKTEKLDSGRIRQVLVMKARARLSDHILDRRLARLQAKLERYRSSSDPLIRSKVADIEKKINKINKLYGFPSLPILYVDENGKDSKVETKALNRDEFEVISPLKGQSGATLKEPLAKDNLKSGGPRWRLFSVYQRNVYLEYALYGALAALLLLGLGRLLRRYLAGRRRDEPPPPPRPAHEVAYEELSRLGEMIPLKSEKEQEIFAFGLSETIRRYFGARFGFDGLEMTVTEFMEEMSRHHTPGILKDDIHEFLESLEMVKFAKMPLSDSEARDLLERAHVYVERTYEPEEDDDTEVNFANMEMQMKKARRNTDGVPVRQTHSEDTDDRDRWAPPSDSSPSADSREEKDV